MGARWRDRFSMERKFLMCSCILGGAPVCAGVVCVSRCEYSIAYLGADGDGGGGRDCV